MLVRVCLCRSLPARALPTFSAFTSRDLMRPARILGPPLPDPGCAQRAARGLAPSNHHKRRPHHGVPPRAAEQRPGQLNHPLRGPLRRLCDPGAGAWVPCVASDHSGQRARIRPSECRCLFQHSLCCAQPARRARGCTQGPLRSAHNVVASLQERREPSHKVQGALCACCPGRREDGEQDDRRRRALCGPQRPEPRECIRRVRAGVQRRGVRGGVPAHYVFHGGCPPWGDGVPCFGGGGGGHQDHVGAAFEGQWRSDRGVRAADERRVAFRGPLQGLLVELRGGGPAAGQHVPIQGKGRQSDRARPFQPRSAVHHAGSGARAAPRGHTAGRRLQQRQAQVVAPGLHGRQRSA
mmetsp:Transcript_18218/g.44734  ORF Transcript_18218/g.44734 Transcript_18218/m.44734 type:complete len:352 (-) Transcript_18218:2021-3076(-)